MRHLGELDSAENASLFQDYMLTMGVSIHVDEEESGCTLWVKEEDQLDIASTEYDEFCQNSNDRKYSASRKNAQAIRLVEAKRIKEIAEKRVDVRNRWRSPLLNACPVTLVHIAISVVVFLGMSFGGREEMIDYLGIADIKILNEIQFKTARTLPPGENIAQGVIIAPPLEVVKTELARGQFWRVITPIFLHFNIIHILFNMMWLKELGTMCEFRNGSLKMFMMILVLAIVSNMGQYCFNKNLSPFFGGMSGVVYGLFGYVWMKSKYFPGSGFYMQPSTVFWMIGWFFLCMTDKIGPIANHAHGFGLAMGIILAFIPLFGAQGISRNKRAR